MSPIVSFSNQTLATTVLKNTVILAGESDIDRSMSDLSPLVLVPCVK